MAEEATEILEAEGADQAAEPAEAEPQPEDPFAFSDDDSVGQLDKAIKALGEGVLIEEADAEDVALEEPTVEAGEEAEAQEPEAVEPAAELRYTLLDAEGEAVELDLPEGARIQFAADGGQQTVESLNDLVQLAQFGVNYNRRSQELAATQRESLERVSALQKEYAGREEAWNELLAKTVTDEETFERVRENVQKLEDPEFVETQEAKAEAKQLREQQDTNNQQLRTAALQQFWTNLSAHTQSLVTEEHEYLSLEPAEAAQEAMGMLYQQYLQTRENLLPRALELAKQNGQGEEEALAATERVAMSTVLLPVDEKIPQMLDYLEQQKAAALEKVLEKRGLLDLERAQRQNKVTSKKLQQTREVRPMRGGTQGSAPGPSGDVLDLPKPGTPMSERLDKMRELLQEEARS